MMTNNHWEYLGHGIYCIDTGYVRPGLACCYLMVQGDEVAIIETGTSHTASTIAALLKALGISADAVRYIIPTHVHLDHAGGAGKLMAQYPSATLVIHPRGARHMINPEKLIAGTVAVYGEEKFARLYGHVEPIPEERVLVTDDGHLLNLAGRRLLIRHTPGHAEHHFCIWDELSRGWFSGDTFGVSYRKFGFSGGRFIYPTTTPVQFDPDKMAASIALLMSYAPERVYLTHYGVVEQPEQLAPQLLEQIVAYCELALAADQGRLQQDIEERIARLTIERLERLAPEVDSEFIVEQMALDIQLNAQGLVYWLSKQQ